VIDIPALTILAKRFLREDEGFRNKVYPDTKGVMTIGYGRNLETNGITKAEGEYLLENDVAVCMADCARNFPWFGALDLVRQSVIVEVRFNIGLASLLDFRRMLLAISVGNWELAATELLDSDAARDLPARYGRLALRLRTGRLEPITVVHFPDIPVAPIA
jgi:lysozyme